MPQSSEKQYLPEDALKWSVCAQEDILGAQGHILGAQGHILGVLSSMHTLMLMVRSSNAHAALHQHCLCWAGVPLPMSQAAELQHRCSQERKERRAAEEGVGLGPMVRLA